MESTLISNYLVLPNYSNREILNIAETAHKEGKRTVLCSVPEEKIKRRLLRYVSVAVLNEFQMGEAAKVDINGLSSVKTAVLRLYGRGVETIVVKMNDGGTLVFSDEIFQLLDTPEEIYKINNSAITEELEVILKVVSNCS